MAGRNTHRLQASILVFSLTFISTVLANDEEKKRRCNDFRFPGREDHPWLHWKDGRCHCVYVCALNPPACDQLECNGAPIQESLFASIQTKCGQCPAGWTGDCCDVRHCPNGGKLQPDNSCDCTGTGHIGNFCEHRIKSCQNGGEYNEGSNTCRCPKHFKGEECELCYNDFRSNDGVCHCDDEKYSGKYCEKMSCPLGKTFIDQNQLTSSCECYPLATGEFCESLTNGGIAVIVVVVAAVLACLILAIVVYRKHRYRQSFYTDQPLHVTGQTEPDGSATQPLTVTVSHSHDPQVRNPGQSRLQTSKEPTAPPDYEDVIRGE